MEEPIQAEEETEVRERLATLNEDVKTATDAREAVMAIRRNLKTPQPR